jgi:ArsR family transcriptional regulator
MVNAVMSDGKPTNDVPEINEQQQNDVLRLCRMLSDGTRLKILLLLAREPELHVKALCQRLQQSQPAVSHHLALLKDAGVLEMRREGKHNFYSVRRPHLRVVLDLFDAVQQTENALRS